MRHGSVFSGIGGPEVAASMLGWENVFHCEINPFGRRILEYWYPNSDSYNDITKTDFTKYKGQIDVLTGGFPCQPFSYAGKRNGAEDDRYLWPEMLRVINEIRPTWFVGENVNGIRTMVEQGGVIDLGCETSFFQEGDNIHRYEGGGEFTVERICKNLESIGYSVQPIVIPACAIGAPHRRDRIFFIAHANRSSNMRESGKDEGKSREEWVSKRNEIRQSNESSDVRRVASDTHCDRGGEVYEHIQPELADGAEPFSNGRKRNVTDPDCKGFQEPFPDGREAQSAEAGAGKDHRTERSDSVNNKRRHVADTESESAAQHKSGQRKIGSSQKGKSGRSGSPDNRGEFESGKGLLPENRWANFPSVSPVHRGNDGLPFNVGNLTIPFSKWRTESLKAYGNAIVPQVMYEIFRAIEQVENERQ